MCAGQHCGLSGHNFGTQGTSCAVHYVVKNCSFDRIIGRKGHIQFGASGGNPVMPTFHTPAGDDSFRLQQGVANPMQMSLVSGHLDGFKKLAGCKQLRCTFDSASTTPP